MADWDHRLNRHEFEQTPGDSERQGSLVCCRPWAHRVRRELAEEQQRQAADPKAHLRLRTQGKMISEGQ